MDCSVSYDVWQMECCGVPFARGSRIKWLVEKRCPRNIPPEIDDIDYRYEAHSGDWEKLFVLTGTVDSVHLLCQPPVYSQIPGWKLIETDEAVGFEQAPDGMECQNYIVKITDCTIRPASEEDLRAEDDAYSEDEPAELSE